MVRQVMKKDLGLGYRQIKRVTHNSNSDRNLILRQQFAFKMLDLLKQKKRILNIDQTWLSDTNFSNKKWRARGSTNSLEEKIVNPRISVIAAIDTEGDMYLSLTQVNTDTPIMKMYLSYLAEALDNDRPDWRENTVILLDGA